MTSTTTRTSPKEDPGIALTVSSRAGRLLFALLLSSHDNGIEALSTLSGIPKKHLAMYIDELKTVNAEQSPDLQAVNAAVSLPSIPHSDPDPEELVEAACRAADESGDTKAQALAVIEVWKLFFPEVNKSQELQPRKAKEWVKLAGDAGTVFGWLSGVDEKRLLSMGFPLAWVSKIIVNKAGEAHHKDKPDGGAEGVPDTWRQYAQELIEQGGNSHVGQNITGHLARITQAVRRGPSEPA